MGEERRVTGYQQEASHKDVSYLHVIYYAYCMCVQTAVYTMYIQSCVYYVYSNCCVYCLEPTDLTCVGTYIPHPPGDWGCGYGMETEMNAVKVHIQG